MNYSTQQKSSKVGPFFLGVFTGMVICLLIAGAAGFYLMNHPQQVLLKAVDLGLQPVMEKTAITSVEKTLASLPQATIAERETEINQTFQKLTTAYASNRMNEADVQALSSQLFNMLSDQQITSREIDAFLQFANQRGF